MADSILSDRFIRPAPDRVRVWTAIGFAMLVALMATTLPCRTSKPTWLCRGPARRPCSRKLAVR
jgi:hypothetical protein